MRRKHTLRWKDQKPVGRDYRQNSPVETPAATLWSRHDNKSASALETLLAGAYQNGPDWADNRLKTLVYEGSKNPETLDASYTLLYGTNTLQLKLCHIACRWENTIDIDHCQTLSEDPWPDGNPNTWTIALTGQAQEWLAGQPTVGAGGWAMKLYHQHNPEAYQELNVAAFSLWLAHEANLVIQHASYMKQAWENHSHIGRVFDIFITQATIDHYEEEGLLELAGMLSAEKAVEILAEWDINSPTLQTALQETAEQSGRISLADWHMDPALAIVLQNIPIPNIAILEEEDLRMWQQIETRDLNETAKQIHQGLFETWADTPKALKEASVMLAKTSTTSKTV